MSDTELLPRPKPELVRRLEVFTGTGGRRSWTAEQKAQIVDESYSSGETVSTIARRHGLTPQQLFGWRRQGREKQGEDEVKNRARMKIMTAPMSVDKGETLLVRAHYEGVAHNTLTILWRRKSLILGTIGLAVFFALALVVLMGPRYTAEAIIQLNFLRQETANGAKFESIASVEAAALVDSAARVLRSRWIASAVVAQLGLDKDPNFAREPSFGRVFRGLWSTLGIETQARSPRDLATSTLMRKIKVTNESRSYLISIAVESRDPTQSAELANAVALQYLLEQALQQLSDEEAAAERELSRLSSVYGAQHPSYIQGRARVEDLQARLRTLRHESPAADVIKLVAGQSFVGAEKVLVPSGPNTAIIFAVAVAGALGLGIWLALLIPPEFMIRTWLQDVVSVRASTPGRVRGFLFTQWQFLFTQWQRTPLASRSAVRSQSAQQR